MKAGAVHEESKMRITRQPDFSIGVRTLLSAPKKTGRFVEAAGKEGYDYLLEKNYFLDGCAGFAASLPAPLLISAMMSAVKSKESLEYTKTPTAFKDWPDLSMTRS